MSFSLFHSFYFSISITFAYMDNSSCILFNTIHGGKQPHAFHHDYHVHILVNKGTMTFSDGKNKFTSGKDDIVIWQMSNDIRDVSYSHDFDADVLLASPLFLKHFNPEMTWATRGYLFIRQNPSFHLHDENLRIIRNDFEQFRLRLSASSEMFKIDLLGNQMRMFLYDLWVAYSDDISKVKSAEGRQLDNSSQIFLRFVSIVQKDCRKHRDVAYYADQLCITPKYLSQVSNTVTNVPALQWINYYSGFELVSLLDNPDLTIADIAFDMDFSSANHLTRYCKKILGVTPSEYRKKK